MVGRVESRLGWASSGMEWQAGRVAVCSVEASYGKARNSVTRQARRVGLRRVVVRLGEACYGELPHG